MERKNTLSVSIGDFLKQDEYQCIIVKMLSFQRKKMSKKIGSLNPTNQLATDNPPKVCSQYLK